MKDIFLRNLPTKIVAVLAAAVLWVFVMSNENPPTDSGYNVPVTVLNAPGESKITKSEDTVHISLRGPRSAFATLAQDEIKAVADLAGMEPGEHPVPLQAIVPHGFELVSVSPDIVTFFVDPIVQKRMPIELVRVGTSPTGMAVASIDPDTRMATLVGPNTVIERVSRVAGHVSIPADATADVAVEVPLFAEDYDGKAVERIGIVPRKVSVYVQFARGLSKKIVDVAPMFEGSVPAGHTLGTVTVDPARIEIAGAAGAIDGIAAVSTEPIPLSNVTNTVKRTVSLILPEGITVTNRQVTVHIEVDE